jgi:5-methylcytosine-specific restriction endonuclease McrA
LNYLKESKSNWNDIILIGYLFIDISLDKAIKSLYREDNNTKILRMYLENIRKKNKEDSYIGRDLMLLISSYYGKPLDKIEADISNSDLISCKLKERFQILSKYGFKCVYCGRSPPEVKLQLEHIKPKKEGGKDNDKNYVPACFECNSGKRARLLGKEQVDLIKQRFFSDDMAT